MTWTRSIPWLLSLALAGCGAATGGPAAVPSGEGDAGARPLPGEPVVVELSTDRAHVVRLEETEAGGDRGVLEIAAGVAGAMVVVDGEDPAPLPLSREIGAGAHEVIVSCPDGSTETMTVSLEPGMTVTLRVCNAPVQGP